MLAKVSPEKKLKLGNNLRFEKAQFLSLSLVCCTAYLSSNKHSLLSYLNVSKCAAMTTKIYYLTTTKRSNKIKSI
jgi:hypothetical protein